MKKIIKKGLKITFICIITISMTLLIRFGWAKYIEQRNGQAIAQIAEMKFKINGNYHESTENIEFSTTITKKNPKVADGMLAPGTEGEIPLSIDATETQTSLEYEINIGLTYKPTNLKFYSDKNMTEEILVKDNKITRRGYILVSSENAQDKKKNETIYWKWPTETGETRNEIFNNDVEDGKFMNKIMTMKVDVKGKQINKEPTYLGDSIQVGDIVNYKVSGTENFIKYRVVNKTASQVEMMPIDEDGYAEYVKTETGKKVKLGFQNPTATAQVRMLQGIDSYNNAIKTLNEAAIEGFKEKYGFDEAIRALTVDDVNRLTGYKPNPTNTSTTYTNDGWTFIIDNQTTVKISGAESEISAISLTRNGERLFPGDIITIGNASNQVDQGIIEKVTMSWTKGENTNAYYHYKSGTKALVTDYFSETKGVCWLASRCIAQSENGCYFCVRSFIGTAISHSCDLFRSYNQSDSKSYPVVPVISLFAKMHIGQEDNGYVTLSD